MPSSSKKSNSTGPSTSGLVRNIGTSSHTAINADQEKNAFTTVSETRRLSSVCIAQETATSKGQRNSKSKKNSICLNSIRDCKLSWWVLSTSATALNLFKSWETLQFCNIYQCLFNILKSSAAFAIFFESSTTFATLWRSATLQQILFF